jgi:hypothetical protein
MNIIKPEMTRKESALKIKEQKLDLQALLFRMLDNKDYSDLIWKNLYPKYSKPFKKDE